MIIEQLNSIAEFGSILMDVEQKFNDLSYVEPLIEFQKIIAAGEQDAFNGQREPGGSPWAPLKPSTVARKGHSRILYETGSLMASLTQIDGPGNINAVSDRGSIFGTDVEYAIYHQNGTPKMPARPPVGTNDEDVDKLCELIADYIVESLKYKL